MATITRWGSSTLVRTCQVADCGDLAWFDVTDAHGGVQSACWRAVHVAMLRRRAERREVAAGL